MKKVLFIGSIITDLNERVVRLPKGNEDFCPISSGQKVSGSCYVPCLVMNGFGFDYEAFPFIGSGVYGDYAASECDRNSIPYIRSEEIAGCYYTMEDNEGETTRMSVPGCEYDFDYSILQDSDPDDLLFVVVYGDMLCGQDGDEIIRCLEDLNLPILFVPTDQIDEVDPELLNELYHLNPDVFASDTQAYYMTQEKHRDMKEVSEAIAEQTHGNVYIFQNKRGVFGKDGTGYWFAGEDHVMNFDTVVSAYIVARASKVDEKNAMMFAVHFGSLRRHGLPKPFDYEEQRHRLVEIIKGC